MALISPSRLRAIAIIATIAVMVAHYLLPPKHIVIHPAADNAMTIYSDIEWGGESTVTWQNEGETRWHCVLKPSPAHPVCGLSVHWNDTARAFIDAHGFASLKVTLRYKGPAHTLRIYMRNYDGRHGVEQDRDTHKFMYVNIPTNDFGDFNKSYTTDIALTEFQVADWWRDEFKVDRNNAKPQFNHITSFGVDFPFPHVMGDHTIELERVELVGTWIKAEVLYLGIILTWLTTLFVETTWRMYRWRKLAKENLRQVKDLTDYAQSLRERSEKYRELSHIDNLTEVYNRYGFMQTLKSLFGKGTLNGSLMIIDIDHFKHVNDGYGHVQGDQILFETAQLFSKNIRKSDIFARWGGEEFVLLVPRYDLSQAVVLSEKLRLLIEQHQFPIAKGTDNRKLNLEPIAITVSIGLTSFSRIDSLNSAFIRADEALYAAKSAGRNRVVAV
ncbi:MAG TPA: GGDEF domain-containing protein [Marinagarivorans sp.]